MRHDVFCLRGTWCEASDFRPAGAAEASVELPDEVTLGFHVAHPFGPYSDAMIQIHAERASGAITLAIGTVIERAIPVDPAQSNPRRHPDPSEGDGA